MGAPFFCAALWMITALVSAPAEAQDTGTVVVGSKNFTENRLLGEIFAQLLEAKTDLHVERKLNLGGTMMVLTSAKSGSIDVFPDYTGTAWIAALGHPEATSDSLELYARVSNEYREEFGFEVLSPLGFSNTYAIALHESVADKYGISRISDLRKYRDELRGGLTHECLQRQDCYLGLKEKYGFSMPHIRGMEHGLKYEALRTKGIDFVDAYTTDGKLLRYNVRLLEDDKEFFAPYDAIPVVRQELIQAHPEVRDALNLLAYRIDEERMRELNLEVEESGGDFATVAREFLASLDLVEKDEVIGQPNGKQRNGERSFLSVMWQRRTRTLTLAAEHLWLTLIAVILAMLMAVPIGIWLTRKPWLSPTVLGIAGVVQTIPSLALIAFMIPIPGLGLGARSAIAALFLYALLPIMRNTFTGINEVDPNLVEAARGIGLTDRQILRRVELPLAMRTIMAGIRTSTVISIGVATLAAFIGAGGLGDPIVTGLQLNDTILILSGAVPAALLALGVDGLLGLVEKRLTPKGIA